MNSAGSLPRIRGDAGQLVIETGKAELDETYADKKTEVLPGTYVMIAISDTGAGIHSLAPRPAAGGRNPLF